MKNNTGIIFENAGGFMDRYAEFVQFLEKHFIAPENVIYSQIDKQTFLPVTEELFKDCPSREENPELIGHAYACVPGFTRSEFFSYEDTGMSTGATITAAAMEYKRTKNPAALDRVKRLFSGIKNICARGAELEEGFITKFYGGKLTMQTSTDQCLYLMWGMDACYDLLSADDRAFIEKQIPAIVDFWVRHNYTWSYFEHKDMVWPPLRFPPMLLMAWHYSGEARFKKEADRIMAENIAFVPEFDHLTAFPGRIFSDYELKNNVRSLFNIAACVIMDVMNLSLMLRYEPDHEFAPIWKKGIAAIWDQGRRVIKEDGFASSDAFYQPDTGKTVLPYDDYPQPWAAKTSWSTMIVSGGLLGLSHMPEKREEVLKYADLVLGKLAPEDMIYKEELHNFPQAWCYQDKTLSGDAISSYLWSYELLQRA